mmetsp:Transcript_19175/g.18518  ORF Transcript_19175/g.18518 Transcript_19175/m.18518 type:complete len:172 (-) Transcript_19175:301-816(-)
MSFHDTLNIFLPSTSSVTGIISFLIVNSMAVKYSIWKRMRRQFAIEEEEKLNFKQTSVYSRTSPSLFYKAVLNDLIFQQLQGFLNDTNIGTNDLLNVSKKFECFKKGHFYWKLNRRYSLSYKNSSLHRNRLSLLINSRNQLSLDLSEFLGLHDVSAHADVRDIDLSRCLFI